MVNYIGKRPGMGWKGYLLAGGAALALAFGVSRLTCNNNEQISFPNIPLLRAKTIDEKLDSVLAELKEDPEAMNRNYSKLAEAVEQGFKEHPEYANKLIKSGLESTTEISQEAYMSMFERIKIIAEEKPQLMDHFGPNAHTYIEKKIVDKYVGTVEEAFRNTTSSLKENSKPVLEALGQMKDYVMKKLEGEAK